MVMTSPAANDNVVQLDAFRKDPHLVFPTLDNNVHVLPVSLINDWISGKVEFSVATEDERLFLRSIINDWKVRALCL